MGKKDDKFIIILDIDRVLSTDEIGELQEVRNAEEDAVQEKLEVA